MMTFAHAKEANSRTFARETTSLKSTSLQFFHLVQKRTSSVNHSVYMDHSAYVTVRNHPRTATENKLCLKYIWIPYGCASLLHTASVSADSKLLLRDAAA